MRQNDFPVFGPGSQPAESDSAELDYIPMPSSMSTYSVPEVPEPEAAKALPKGMAILEQLLLQLRKHTGGLNPPINLQGLDAANLDLINQVLGEGDVSITLEERTFKTQIQESVLAGVWRVQSVGETGAILSDHIEVARIPWAVSERSFESAQKEVIFDPSTLPDGVMNAPPLLSEINEHIPRVTPDGLSHTINLSLLPQTEADLAYLQQLLGRGRVTILSRGYGNCRVTSTNTKNVWWVQYYNSQDTLILNTLEIVKVPEVTCAGIEDIVDSAQRLKEILEVYQ